MGGKKNAMTKSDLIDLLCEAEKMPKGRAELLINAIFDCMEASLRRGERIEIRGFGSFEIRSYRAYEGRNPRTGSAVSVKPKRLPFFKVGKELKERVNAAAERAAAAKQIPDGGTPSSPSGNGVGSPQNGSQTSGASGASGSAAGASGKTATAAAAAAAPGVHRAASA
jgi:integration host factor subunit beta